MTSTSGSVFLTMISVNTTSIQDPESQTFLHILAEEERIRKNKLDGVKTILVILSGRSMVFDTWSLKQKITLTYPDSKIYIMTSGGYPIGEKAPNKLDLVIDFTGPRHGHKWFLARKLRAQAKYCIGRPAWFFREWIYDRVVPEFQMDLPKDVIERERLVQKEVLELAGVPLSQKGNTMGDLGKTIAKDLPHFKR